MFRLTTPRLHLRELNDADAAFILRLLNEPSFIDNIGDKGVRTLDDARAYIANGPAASYARHGFGLWAMVREADGALMGMSGLIQRDSLDDVDIGYALLPEFAGQGYALEAGQAVMRFARENLGLARVVAIVSPHNTASIRLLEKLGFGFERMIRMPGEDKDIKLLACVLGE